MVERSFGGGNFFGGGGGGRGNSPNWNALFSMSDISEKTRAHLVRVYFTLFLSTCSSIVGAYLNAQILMEGFLLSIVAIIGMGFFTYQVTNKTNSEDQRIGFLLALTFFMGFLIGPGMHMIAALEP